MTLIFCRHDKYAAMSVDARQELELKIGVAFSRLMTRAYLDLAKEKFRIRDLKVISFGPCQTKTLWFLCPAAQRDPGEYFLAATSCSSTRRTMAR